MFLLAGWLREVKFLENDRRYQYLPKDVNVCSLNRQFVVMGAI